MPEGASLMLFSGDPASVWSQIAHRLPWMAPMLLVAVGGIVTAAALAGRRRAPAACVIVALGALSVVALGTVVARELLMAGVYRGERWHEDVRPLLTLIDVVGVLVHAGGVGLLVLAALAWGGTTPMRESDHETPRTAGSNAQAPPSPPPQRGGAGPAPGGPYSPP